MTAQVETHVEPFVQLVDVTHDAALIGWGAMSRVPRHRGLARPGGLTVKLKPPPDAAAEART